MIAPDLRGHGRSGWEPPWNHPTYVADLVETADALGIGEADWVGHSFGGRLSSSSRPRIRSACAAPSCSIRDPRPAPHRAGHREDELAEPVYASPEEYADAPATAPTPRELVLEDAALHCDRSRRTPAPPHLPAGDRLDLRRVRLRAAAAETLRAPTLLLYAPAFGLVRDEHLEAYAAASSCMPSPACTW